MQPFAHLRFAKHAAHGGHAAAPRRYGATVTPIATIARATPGPAGDAVARVPRRRLGAPWVLAVGALTAWSALVAISIHWGEDVVAAGHRLRIHAPPLTGSYEWRVGVDAIAALVVGAAIVVVVPAVARRASWSALLATVVLASVAWAVALALVDGWGALTDPLLPGQYLRTVPRVGDPFVFLSQFTDRIATYNIHTQGHPPGMVLVLWALDRIGLGGTGPNAVLVLLGGAASLVAALVAVREVAGEDRARAAAPWLVVLPAAIWWTSGDAFFAGVGGWGIALVVLATGRTGRRSDVLAAAGGALLGGAAFLSYGLVLLAVVPIVVAFARRRPRPIAVAALGALPVFAVFAAAGFWWPDGLGATHARYVAGVASRRPYSYFVVGNLGALAIAMGPVLAVALAWLRDRRVWWLVAGGLAMVVLADVSGLSKAEVERIWLPFVPWIALAGAAFGVAGVTRRWPAVRIWLALQVTAGLLVEVAVRSPW